MTTDFRAPLRAPGASRFRWQTGPEGVGPDWGSAHRKIRTACGLTVEDVARAYGIRLSEVAELERGHRRFPDRRDAWAALSQLWLMRRGEP